MRVLNRAGMWKMQTSNTVPNMAQEVLCNRNTEIESSNIT